MALRLSEVEKIHCPNGRMLISWMRKFRFFAPKRIHIVKNTDDELYIKIYTVRNCYAIRAVGTEVKSPDWSMPVRQPNYLGCGVSRRTPRPGEDWTRGGDLSEGRFCQPSFLRLLGAIVCYEALEVAKDIEPIIVNEKEKS